MTDPSLNESTTTAAVGMVSDAQAAFDKIVHANYARLLRIVTAKVWDPQLAADLTNDAVEITLRRVRSGRLRVPEEIPGYVLGTVANLLRNHRRDKDNRPDLRADAETLAGVIQPEKDELHVERMAQLVRTVITSLKSSRDRQIVVRYYLEEDDKQSICTDFGVTALQLDKLLFRVRERMRALFTARGLGKQEFLGLLLWLAAGVLAQLVALR